MDYNPESDSYTCRNGKQLTAVSQNTRKTATGYRREITIYECDSCDSCPYKKDCIKGNNCMTAFEDRNKKLSVSRKMEEKRAECLERITSDYGTQLRMNRSIQAEGSFANVKENMNFRRYLYRGKENVLAQSILLAIGYDITVEDYESLPEQDRREFQYVYFGWQRKQRIHTTRTTEN